MNNMYYNECQYPEKLNIFYSKFYIILGFIISICLFVFGLYLFFTQKTGLFIWLLPILFSLVPFFSSKKKYKSKGIIQLSISNKQIVIKESKVFKWENIRDEKVEEIRSGKSSNTYLTFYHKGIKELIDIQDLEFDSFQLQTALKVYRKRYENSISQ